MKLAVDVMGGDNAPQAVLDGVLAFFNESEAEGVDLKLFGKPVYELAFYFYMNVPADFALTSDHLGDGEEKFVWVAPYDPKTLYPGFMREALLDPKPYVVHDVRDDR